MSKTQQTARERIGHALYMLAAGADEAVLMQTLRAFLLQHVQTTEQALELLRELAGVNPPAFEESLQTLIGERSEIERTYTATLDTLAQLVGDKKKRTSTPSQKSTSGRTRGQVRQPR